MLQKTWKISAKCKDNTLSDLNLALKSDDPLILKKVFKNNKKLTLCTPIDKYNRNILHYIYQHDRVKLANFVLETSSAQAVYKACQKEDDSSRTPLTYAVKSKNPRAVIMLFAKLSPKQIRNLLKRKDMQGQSAIHLLINNRFARSEVRALELLPIFFGHFKQYEVQSIILARDEHGNNMVQLAMKGQKAEVVMFLIGRLSDRNTKIALENANNNHDTSMHIIAANGDTYTGIFVANILSHVAESMMNNLNNQGDTPLHSAVRYSSNTKIIEFLHSLFPHEQMWQKFLQIPNKMGRTALETSINTPFLRHATPQLVLYGAKIKSEDMYKRRIFNPPVLAAYIIANHGRTDGINYSFKELDQNQLLVMLSKYLGQMREDLQKQATCTAISKLPLLNPDHDFCTISSKVVDVILSYGMQSGLVKAILRQLKPEVESEKSSYVQPLSDVLTKFASYISRKRSSNTNDNNSYDNSSDVFFAPSPRDLTPREVSEMFKEGVEQLCSPRTFETTSTDVVEKIAECSLHSPRTQQILQQLDERRRVIIEGATRNSNLLRHFVNYTTYVAPNIKIYNPDTDKLPDSVELNTIYQESLRRFLLEYGEKSR